MDVTLLPVTVTSISSHKEPKVKKLIAVLFLFVAGPAIAADQGLYAGVNYTQADYKESGFATVTPTALVFKLGKELTPNIAIEGRLGTGLSDDGLTVSGVQLTVDIDNFYGVYFKGMLPTGSITPYGLIGFTKSKLTFTGSVPGFTIAGSDSESSLSYGVGVDFQLSKTTAINLEYAQLVKGDGYKLNGFSVGVAFRF